jgi:hypothetical protein
MIFPVALVQCMVQKLNMFPHMVQAKLCREIERTTLEYLKHICEKQACRLECLAA